MGILDSLGDVLKKYNSAGTENNADATQHFDQVAEAAPHHVIAEGTTAVFRSDKTLPSVIW